MEPIDQLISILAQMKEALQKPSGSSSDDQSCFDPIEERKARGGTSTCEIRDFVIYVNDHDVRIQAESWGMIDDRLEFYKNGCLIAIFRNWDYILRKE